MHSHLAAICGYDKGTLKGFWLVAVFGVVLVGCGSGGFSHRAATQASGTLRYPLNSDITTLDPAKVQDVDYIDLLSNVFEGLVSYDENNQIVGQLAEKWEVINHGKTYVFHLRKTAKFHNGRVVTADDVKYSLERSCSAAIASATASNYLTDIVGVKDYSAGKAKAIEGIKVIDPQTVSISIDKPRAYFLGKLTYPCGFVVCKEAVSAGEISKLPQTVGTGPFKITKLAAAQEVDLDANDAYYLGRPKLDHLARPIVMDAATRLNQFKTGSLDILTLPRQDLDAVKKDPILSKQLQMQDRPAVYYVMLQEKNYPPFAKKEVRQAFAMAIDKQHVAGDILGGLPPAEGFLPPGIPGYRKDFAGVRFDAAGAKKLLAQAGFSNPASMPPLEFACRAQSPDATRAAQAIAIQLEQNLGVKVNLKEYEWSALLAKRNKRELQMAFQSWYGDYLDPQNFLSLLLTSKAEMNTDNFSDPEFDRLCALGDVEPDAAKRAAYYQKAEDIIILSAERIPIYFQQDPVLVNPRVKGLKSNLMGQLPLRTAEVGH